MVQWRQSGLKTGGVVGPIKIQQTEACNTGFRVSSQELLFNYIQILLFLF